MKKIFNLNSYKLFFWCFFGLFSLGQLQRIELSLFFPSVQAGLYLHELLMGIFVLLHLQLHKKNLKYFINNSRAILKKHKTIFAFTTWCLLVTTITQFLAFDFIALLYLLRLLLYLTFAYTIYLTLKNKKIDLSYFHFQVFSVGVFSLILGLLQYIFIPDTRFLSIFGWDDHYARLIGAYFDPGFTGIIFIISLLIGLAHPYLKKVKYFLLLLFGVGIALTFSRASYLAFITALSILFLQMNNSIKKKILLPLAVLCFFAITVILIPKPFGEGVDLFRSASVHARLQAIQEQMTDVNSKTILIGDGFFSKINTQTHQSHPATYLLPSHSRVPDNMFIAIFRYTGVVGLLLFILISGKYLQVQFKNQPYLLSILTAFLISGQFANVLFQPFTQLVLLLSIVLFEISKNQIRR